MAYQMAATAVTLNDLQGNSQVACLSSCNPSNIYAVFYTNSTDTVLAVPLRQLNFPYVNRETTDKKIIYGRSTKSG